MFLNNFALGDVKDNRAKSLWTNRKINRFSQSWPILLFAQNEILHRLHEKIKLLWAVSKSLSANVSNSCIQRSWYTPGLGNQIKKHIFWSHSCEELIHYLGLSWAFYLLTWESFQVALRLGLFGNFYDDSSSPGCVFEMHLSCLQASWDCEKWAGRGRRSRVAFVWRNAQLQFQGRKLRQPKPLQ